MMRGILFDVRRFSVHDGPGIRTTVFFKGCPLQCPWCHNPEGINPEIETIAIEQTVNGMSFTRTETVGRWVSAENLIEELIADRIFYEESGGGITMSGGEPLMQISFLENLLKFCRHNHLHTCVDTSGFADSVDIERLVPLIDLFLYDLKIMDRDLHHQWTGVNLELILENLICLHNAGAEVIIRYPLIPGFNDNEAQLHRLVEFLQPLYRFRRIDILPYHGLGKNKYYRLNRLLKFTADEAIAIKRAQSVREMLAKRGFTAIIGG